MKHSFSLLIFAGLFFTSLGFAAKRKPQEKSVSKAENLILAELPQWNEICQDLLDNSVKSTLKLEKSVSHKRKISKKEFDNKVHNELLVVQLNAWVCAISTREQIGVAAEELFLRDYSKLVQSKKL
jgi:hypothetical protein